MASRERVAMNQQWASVVRVLTSTHGQPDEHEHQRTEVSANHAVTSLAAS